MAESPLLGCDAGADNCTAVECQGCEATCLSVCFDPGLRGFVERCCDCTTACRMSLPHMRVAMGLMLATLVLLSKRRWAAFPVGRSMGAGICAVGVVITGCLPFDTLNDPGIVDMNTIATLFGLTIVTGYLDDFGAVDACMYLMQRRCGSGRQLLFRITVLTTVLSACVTNDAAVIILTKPVLQICGQMRVEPMPFLIALATTANIGSALTLIGNPQNILIAASSGISFFHFTALMAPVVGAGLAANYLLLCMWYHSQLRLGSSSGDLSAQVVATPDAPEGDEIDDDRDGVGAFMPRVSLLGVKKPPHGSVAAAAVRQRRATVGSSASGNGAATGSRNSGSGDSGLHTGLLSIDSDSDGASRQSALSRPVSPDRGQQEEEVARDTDDLLPEPHLSCCFGRQVQWQTIERLVGSVAICGILIGFVVSTSIAWTALTGVAAMALIEVYLRGGEGTDVLRHVDGFLLVMIAGLFIVIASARRTGVPDSLFKRFGELSGDAGCSSGVAEEELGYAAIGCFGLDFDSVADVPAVSALVLVLSNLCSNVPTVMLLAHSLEMLPLSRTDAVIGWLTLSWAATVAGNLTLVGSIANLIVAEKAHQGGVELGFAAHFKFCGWTTLLIAAGGCCIIFFLGRPMVALLNP